jgi:hypothetical protein
MITNLALHFEWQQTTVQSTHSSCSGIMILYDRDLFPFLLWNTCIVSPHLVRTVQAIYNPTLTPNSIKSPYLIASPLPTKFCSPSANKHVAIGKSHCAAAASARSFDSLVNVQCSHSKLAILARFHAVRSVSWLRVENRLEHHGRTPRAIVLEHSIPGLQQPRIEDCKIRHTLFSRSARSSLALVRRSSSLHDWESNKDQQSACLTAQETILNHNQNGQLRRPRKTSRTAPSSTPKSSLPPSDTKFPSQGA